MRVLIVRNEHNPQAIDASLMLSAYLMSLGAEFEIIDGSSLFVPHGASERISPSADAAEPDLAIALGGDGTMLHTAQYVHRWQTPILGMNFGRLGFLANPSDDGVVKILSDALAGDIVEERRTNLAIEVYFEADEPGRAAFAGTQGSRESASRGSAREQGYCGGIEEEPRRFFALNETALTRGSDGRIVDFSFSISGSKIADMRGDGVVVATATGSTAYALSAGGPLVAPSFSGLVVVPISPHTIKSRAVVTDSSDIVEIVLPQDEDPRESNLFVDGDLITFDKPISRVVIRRGDTPTVLLRYKGEGFYNHLAKAFF